jgi:hypothetical protein
MTDENLEVGSVINQHQLDSDGPSNAPTGPAPARSTSNTDGICPQHDPHTEEVSTLDGPVYSYRDGAYCPITWDPVEGCWLKGPITVFRDEDQSDGAPGGDDPMLREAAE